jgi:hypothetical protein
MHDIFREATARLEIAVKRIFPRITDYRGHGRRSFRLLQNA